MKQPFTFSFILRPSIAMLAALIGHAVFLTPGNAAVIASTNFNGRIATGAVASSLSWTINGVNDPSNMTAKNAASVDTNLWDSTTITQNMFAPNYNVGNVNSYWTTNIALTVSSGMTVTLTDVTFDYWAIDGTGVQNVARRGDFTAILFNPSAVSVGTVSINDVSNGGTPGVGTSVSLLFSSSIALTAPGTYTLQIKGGDYAGIDETGFHAAIDNLSVNGAFAAVPEPTTLLLSVFGAAGLICRRKRHI